MAKKSSVAKNNRRRKTAERYLERRQELKSIIKNTGYPQEERDLAMHTLNKLPKDSIMVRVRNRCFKSGRPRSYYRKFGLSRIALRDLALSGELPGVTKSSW